MSEKIVAHIPYYCAGGSKVLDKWTVPFEDRTGNRAILTIVKYQTKKGEIHEVVGQVSWVHLNAPPAYGPISNKIAQHGI